MSNSLKDLYNLEYIKTLSSTLCEVEETFPQDHFIQKVFSTDYEKKELKQRMRHITQCLHLFLPSSYLKTISILEQTFVRMKGDFYLVNIIFQDYVEMHGLADFETSMRALETFTQGSTSEFAIRAFILNDEERTMEVMKEWAKSENEEVRRLASEGCRSRLPWAVALPSFKKDPTKVLEILEILKDDKSKYVQKSVANNLNDISKDNKEMVKALLKEWIGQTKTRDWILKHGSRTLLKQGDKDVLACFGFKNVENISVVNFKADEIVRLEEELRFEFELLSENALGKLRVEFSLEFVRLRGRSSIKVFKISEGDYRCSKRLFVKKFPFKTISSRKYYEGEHTLSIIVNGECMVSKKFMLKA